MSTKTAKPVLIAGAGISGLALAQGLRRASIPFKVFEREAALNMRSQGYRVRIDTRGQDALKSMLEPARYQQFVDSCPPNPVAGPPLVFDALTGEKGDFQIRRGPGGPRPHMDGLSLNVDRGVLRSVLMSGMEKMVEFSKEVKEYEITPEGVTLRFTDGSEAHGSLLVGADGSRSRIKRQFLPKSQLVDTEARLFFGKTPLTAEFESEFKAEALNVMTGLRDSSTPISFGALLEAMRFKDNEFRENLPRDYVYWALFARKDFFADKIESDEELLSLTQAKAAEFIKGITTHWNASFLPLFAHQSVQETSILRIACSSPDLPFWAPSPHITLIGDSVHAMPPTGAAGATTALRDAASLAQKLVDGDINAESIGKYEEEMRVYAGEAISLSLFGGKHLLGMRDFEEMSVIED